MAGTAVAEPAHGIAMYGAPALPADYTALPYANPDAPKGGRIVWGNTGGFDSLNPFVLKGNVPWQMRFIAYESLMGRSWDEPFTLYGLLAETVETGPNREWVEFTLRPEARFSDGSPVTVEDVIWSYETLGTEGHPRYLGFWGKVGKIEQTGERSVRLTFNTEDRELALIAGLRPILKKAQFEGKALDGDPLRDIPIGTAPYVVTDVDPGRQVTLKRNPDYWGNDLSFRRGTHNFDEIRIDFYGDGDVQFEAFKAGELSFIREFNAEAWASRYDFPRAQAGDVIKTEIPHQKPSGMTGFAFNTRRAPFDDIRVRDALIHAFNFEFINDTMTGSRQPRITSYFSGSQLAYGEGAPEGAELALLQTLEDLPPGTLEGYGLPQSDGSLRNRRNMRKAVQLLEDAGWSAEGGTLRNAAGDPFRMEILLRQGDQQDKAIMDLYVKSLEQLGIDATVTLVDDAQFTERETAFDYDMIDYRRSLSLSPGNEQWLYWGQESATQNGSPNLAGVASPAVDALIDRLLTSESHEDFVTTAQALDRVLTAGRYVIPIWQFSVGRIAHVKELKHPDYIPIYGDGVDWMPGVWWWED
ncbi:extracellular solute-binding protein [Shimia biformata]|uniref:extracellular solute-binding protein n=1 Tax=Shimia biformata TaxID=1294299 RepID=UPI001EF225C7|nr:extracellular solute-binding protein [Shimia biformata]